MIKWWELPVNMVDNLLRKMYKKRQEEKESGYIRKGRRSAFEEGYNLGQVIASNPTAVKQYLPVVEVPKSRKKRKEFAVGIREGKRLMK